MFATSKLFTYISPYFLMANTCINNQIEENPYFVPFYITFQNILYTKTVLENKGNKSIFHYPKANKVLIFDS